MERKSKTYRPPPLENRASEQTFLFPASRTSMGWLEKPSGFVVFKSPPKLAGCLLVCFHFLKPPGKNNISRSDFVPFNTEGKKQRFLSVDGYDARKGRYDGRKDARYEGGCELYGSMEATDHSVDLGKPKLCKRLLLLTILVGQPPTKRNKIIGATEQLSSLQNAAKFLGCC